MLKRRALIGLFLALLTAGAALAQSAPPVEPPAEPEARAPQTPEAKTEIAGDVEPEGAPLTRGERLDKLFLALAEEPPQEAGLIQRRIAELWSESGSDSLDLLLSRGREALDAEEHLKAIDHLTALVELEPDFAEGWNARATAYYLNREYWMAVADIHRTLMLEPRHFGALSGLGVILERIGEDAGALVAYREALTLNPHLENARKAVERLEPKVDGRDI